MREKASAVVRLFSYDSLMSYLASLPSDGKPRSEV